jgi:tyrosine-protein kinase Etk/Wzc
MKQNKIPADFDLPEDENIDIKRYISMFLSNWYWFAIALLISMTVAYSINRYSQRIYTVSSTILIKDDQLQNFNNNASSVIPGGDIFRSQQNLRNEMGILKSLSLNYMVMKKLEDFHVIYTSVGRRGIVESRLYKTCPYKIVYDSLEAEPKGIKVYIKIISDSEFILEIDDSIDHIETLSFGSRFSKFGFDFTVVKRDSLDSVYDENGSNRYYFYFTDPQSLAYEYMSKLSTTPIEKEASLVTLSVNGPVAEQEIDYLNELMEVYILYGLENKNKTAESTIEFINDQLKSISDSLTKAENNLEKFKLENNFTDLSREAVLIQQRLEKYENEKTSFELQLQYYNYLSDYLNSTSKGGSIVSPSVMGITDQVLIRLINEFSGFQKEVDKIGFNINNDQPAFVLINKQTEETREALKENVKNGIAGLKQSINQSDKRINEIKSEINKLPTTDKNLINIQRKFDLNNTVYTYLLEKRSESSIAKASSVSDNRIIDNASSLSSSQIRPKTDKNLIVAFMLGLIIPMMLIVLIDYFNNKIIDKKDIERKTKVPVIGYISHSETINGIPVIKRPGSSLSESFRSIRTALKYFVKENNVAVIAVSSTISSEGKTFISTNLAAITSMLGKKVLLMGLDLRKPGINKLFDFEGSQGLSTYLSGNCSYEETIKKTNLENLFYAPSGPIPPNPAELIETDLMGKFIEKAKKEFDYIIIDTPPVGIVTDALLLVKYVDISMFIVRQRYTSRNTLELIEQLRNQGEHKNMAIVINDISLTGYYGYGMRYGYSQGYGYSYGYNYYNNHYYKRHGFSVKGHGYYTED